MLETWNIACLYTKHLDQKQHKIAIHYVGSWQMLNIWHKLFHSFVTSQKTKLFATLTTLITYLDDRWYSQWPYHRCNVHRHPYHSKHNRPNSQGSSSWRHSTTCNLSSGCSNRKPLAVKCTCTAHFLQSHFKLTLSIELASSIYLNNKKPAC